MTEEIRKKIRDDKTLYSLLRIESYHYRQLYQDNKYIDELSKRSHEIYQTRIEDKLDRLKDKINMIETFLNVLE